MAGKLFSIFPVLEDVTKVNHLENIQNIFLECDLYHIPLSLT